MAGSKSNHFHPFVKVNNPSDLFPILERRLPKSLMLYNAVKMYPRFDQAQHDHSRMSFYTLFGDIDDTSLIVYLHYREDMGQVYVFSLEESLLKITRPEALKIFSSCPIFSWDEPYFYAALPKWISSIVVDVGVNHKGNISEVHPCYLFYVERDTCLSLEIKEPPKPAILQRLDPDLGLKFILDTWKYAKPNSGQEVKLLIEKNESGGVYIDRDCVCGVITQGFGLLSALYTKKDHRQKGYADMSMKYVFKMLAEGGLVPGSTVELRNGNSIKFHEKLGCKVGDTVDYILFTKPEF